MHMDYAYHLGQGVLVAALLVWLGRKLANERKFHAFLLLFGAFWYVGSGLVAGASFQILIPQIVGGFLFAALAIGGLARSYLYVGIGWLVHGTWDVTSDLFSDIWYIQHWLEPMCISYDLLVGSYLLARWKGAFPIRKGEPMPAA